MRILHVTMASVPGGVLRVIESLAAAQVGRHRVFVISGPGGRPDRLSSGVRWAERRVRGNSDLGALWWLLRKLRMLSPDAVLIHACAPGELALLAALSSRRRRTVVLEHAPQHHPLGTPTRNRAYAWLNRRASVWAAVSNAGARALEAEWNLPPGTLRAVHLGVSEPAAHLSEGERRVLETGSGPVLLGIGKPTQPKGFDTFVLVARKVAKEFPGARWIWVGGDGEAREGPVQVLPWSSSIGGWLRAADVLLIPSRAEGLPLVLLEAFACRTPVAASAVGGIPEAVEDGVSGWLVPPEDVEGWCRTVGRLLGDPGLRGRLGEAGRRRWEEQFTVEAMTRRIEELFSPSV